jgi:catechol 2,3-dioxygenase-like lactoylglutathione lyase family enzyme
VTTALFAGIPVEDFSAALAWYEKLLGAPPAFFPNEREAVWELAENRMVYIELRPGHAGHGKLAVIVDDLDGLLEQIAGRGLEPETLDTYENGVRKATYRDPDGNEFGFGGLPG